MARVVCGSCSSLRAPTRARHRRAIDTLAFQEEILFAARPVMTSAAAALPCRCTKERRRGLPGTDAIGRLYRALSNRHQLLATGPTITRRTR